MPRGGYRPGAGAKPGGARRSPKLAIVRKVKQVSADVISDKIAAKVVNEITQDDGITPVGVMIQVMRHLWRRAQPDPAVIGGELDIDLARQAVVAAAQVAPYIHAKIAPAEAKPPKPTDTQPVDVQDVARRIAFVLAVSTQESKSLAVLSNSADNHVQRSSAPDHGVKP